MNSESDQGADIRIERSGKAGLITLTRPAALNALTHEMVRVFQEALLAWESDPEIAAVLIRGEGRAFCAGGDIARVYRECREGRPPVDFFYDEYQLNAYLRAYPKPCVSLIDGIVMGGGVGISVHGSHRILSEKTRFAMPEVGIGFFPDVGGSYFLPRLRDRFGYYLGLTGAHVGWGDCLRAGIATDCIPSEALDGLVGEICDTGDVAAAIASRRTVPQPETPEEAWRAISEILAGDSVPAIVERLEAESGEWAAKALAAMRRASPTSLHVTLRLLTEGSTLSMEECMRMEFRIVTRMLAGNDFMEGIRAVLIDKDGKPDWRPATLAEIEPARDVDGYFAPLPEGEWQPLQAGPGR